MPQPHETAGAIPQTAVDLRTYVEVLQRRWRFLAAATAIVFALTALYSFTRTPVYTGVSEVLVQPPTASAVYRPDQLVSLDTEARLVTAAPIAAIAKETMGSPLSVRDLLEHVSVETTPDTLVLDISYWDTDPAVAAAGAEAFARGYLTYKRERGTQAVSQERNDLQEQIDAAQAEREELNQVLEESDRDSVEFRNAQADRDTLTGQIGILTTQLLAVPPSVDPGEVILPATVPTSPSSPDHKVNLALGLLLGGFIGIAGAFVRDRVDDRVRSRSDVEAALDSPVLAVIPSIDGWSRQGPVWLVTEEQPTSPGAEAYRTLRTSIMAMGRQRNVRVVAVVGATLGEGKTATTANLASALAQAENRVLALSADLRRPRLHDFFHVVNGAGLSEVLGGTAAIDEVIKRRGPRSFIVTSGSIANRPAELLESEAMAALIRTLREQFDFVIIDTPPVLGLADALAIATLADAVLFVAHADTSRRSVLTQAAEQLRRLGVSIDGCVLTDVTFGRQNAYGYGGAYGYTPDRIPPPSQTEGPASPDRSERAPVATIRQGPATKAGTPPRASKSRGRQSGQTGRRDPIRGDGRTGTQ